MIHDILAVFCRDNQLKNIAVRMELVLSHVNPLNIFCHPGDIVGRDNGKRYLDESLGHFNFSIVWVKSVNCLIKI